jgi:hypothetical protein
MYSVNECKIVKNKYLEIIQQFDYDSLKSEYDELIDLCEIFSHNESQSKVKTLLLLKKSYDLQYIPILKEKKKILENTKKRFKYNFQKASS